MATNITETKPSLPASNSVMLPINLQRLNPCENTLVATRTRKLLVPDERAFNDRYQSILPRTCRLKTKDESIGIYAMANPIGDHMLAADVTIKMLVEYLSNIDFTGESYMDTVEEALRTLPFAIDHFLLQLTFDRGAEKALAESAEDSQMQKYLRNWEEADAGAFLFAAAVSSSNVSIAYVGTMRAFVIKNENGHLSIAQDTQQYYKNISLHTTDNDDEALLWKQRGDITCRMITGETDRNQTIYTRCIGQLAKKMLFQAQDSNEAHGIPLICEPTLVKFKIQPHHYALVVMNNKLFDLCLKSGIHEDEVPLKIIEILQNSMDSKNPAEEILGQIEEHYNERQKQLGNKIVFEEIGLLIHFFDQRTISTSGSVPLPDKLSRIRRPMDGEVSVDEIALFAEKNSELQKIRESKLKDSSKSGKHHVEKQLQKQQIEPFVQFNTYMELLDKNEQFRKANEFVTSLLYNQPTHALESQLNEFLQTHKF